MGRGKGGKGLGKGGAKRARVKAKRHIKVSRSSSSDPLITTKRSRDQLLSLIKINHIKQNLNDQVLSVCINPILKLFGSNADLLEYLTKYSSKHQLDQMYEIIHETMQEFRTLDQNVYIAQNEKSKNASDSHLTSYQNFELISDESTVNICSFLSRDDIKTFKSISRRIGIICLNEMNKYCVGICLSRNLSHLKRKKALEWNERVTFNRYHIATTFSSIFENEEKANNFAEKYQIPISIDENGEYHNITRFDQIHPKSSLIIFDKRDLTILDSMNNREMRENDIFHYDTHCILALYHFDVYHQEISLIKFLIIDKSITSTKLKEYIKDKLIENSDLKNLLNVNSNKHNIDDVVKLYPMRNDINLSELYHDQIMENLIFKGQKIIQLVFQIGAKMAMYDRKNRKFEYEISELKLFRDEYRQITYSNDKTIALKWCDEELINLKQQIECYMTATNQSKQVLYDIIKQINTRFTNKFQFVFDTSVQLNILKHYFSRFMFKNVIPAKFIEIYKNTSWGICDDLQLSNISNISLDIVPYDTTNTRYNDRIFRVHLYPQQQAPFPFNSTKINEKPIKIAIKINWKTECTVHQIVDEIMKVSKNPFFGHQSEEINETLNNYMNTTNPNCYVLINDYKYYEERSNLWPDSYDSYYEKYQILYDSHSTKCVRELNNKHENIKHLNVLMIPNAMSEGKEHQLMVRFSWKHNLNQDTDRECIFDHFIGLPLFVWCDENDTLQNVLINNQIIQKYKDDIFSIYQVIGECEIISEIEETERNTFEIYNDLLSEDYNGFIVITLKHTDDIHVASWMRNVVVNQHDDLYHSI